MADPAPAHVPVMAERVRELLFPALENVPSPVIVDCTLGLGGHAALLLAASPQARLIGLDRDREALAVARERLASFGDRATLVHAIYDQLPAVLEERQITSVSAVLFDLGVSSLQLDAVQRGFSYARDAPLDMRMDQSAGRSAADIVNGYSVGELARVLRDYGEERFARRIAEAVVAERKRQPLDSTVRLAEIVRDAIPAPARRTGGNPAKRTFQALRIEANAELDALAAAVPAGLAALAPGGRIAVLSYQSLEDRLVKRAFAEQARPSVPEDFPVIPASAAPTLRLLTRGAERPTADEVQRNPRAASARLRAAQRVTEVAA